VKVKCLLHKAATPIERLENGGYEDVLKNLSEGIPVLLIDFLKLFDAAKGNPVVTVQGVSKPLIF
jgi:hypothetical protein